MHAFNLGVVKYDYKILFVVARILCSEVKNLCAKKDEDKKKVDRKKKSTFLMVSFHLESPTSYFASSHLSDKSNSLSVLWN